MKPDWQMCCPVLLGYPEVLNQLSTSYTWQHPVPKPGSEQQQERHPGLRASVKMANWSQSSQEVLRSRICTSYLLQ